MKHRIDLTATACVCHSRPPSSPTYPPPPRKPGPRDEEKLRTHSAGCQRLAAQRAREAAAMARGEEEDDEDGSGEMDDEEEEEMCV